MGKQPTGLILEVRESGSGKARHYRRYFCENVLPGLREEFGEGLRVVFVEDPTLASSPALFLDGELFSQEGYPIGPCARGLRLAVASRLALLGLTEELLQAFEQEAMARGLPAENWPEALLTESG